MLDQHTATIFSRWVIDLSTRRWSEGTLLAATILSVDIALDKLPVDDGKGVLTSRLKYFQRAIHMYNKKLQFLRNEVYKEN